MEFVAIPFPDRIAFGAESNAMWSNDIATALSGFEGANLNWEHARHSYDVGFAIRNVSEYALIRTHFHEVRGRNRSFPFKDFLDFTADRQPLTSTGVASHYQMFKRYGSTNPYDRKITRPVSGTVFVYRTRAGTTTNITGSSTVDHDTGDVTVTSHMSGDTYTWSGEFNVPCRYDTDRLPGRVTNKEPAADGELLVVVEGVQIVEVREGAPE